MVKSNERDSSSSVVSPRIAPGRAEVRSMQILSEGEREAIIEGFSQTRRPYPEPVSMASLFEAVASRCNDEIAVSDGERRLGYRELNERANQLASHLRGLDVRAETIVAVCMDRSVDLAVAVLAVLKAGGAWLPLAPNQPRARLTSMLDDARPAILLTEDRLVGGLPETGLPIVRIDADWLAISLREFRQRGRPREAGGCGIRHVHVRFLGFAQGSDPDPSAGSGTTSRPWERLSRSEGPTFTCTPPRSGSPRPCGSCSFP